MTLATGLPAFRRLALGAALLGLVACPAEDGDDEGAGTDTTLTTTTTMTMSASTTTPADSSESGAETTPVDVDYATDIQPIWDANCLAGCHEPGGISGAVSVDLTAGMSHNVLTTQQPVYTAVQDTFVEPGDAAESFLIDALRHDEPAIIVRQMPLLLDDSVDPPVGLAGTPLPEETIVLVEAWIDAGANP